MSALEVFEAGLDEHAAVLRAVRNELAAPFEQMLGAWEQCIRGGGKILFCGNGGSASDAQHLATELTIRYSVDRPAIAALALTTDTSALTAAANDFGYETVFARQVEALGRPGDVLVAISTSGRSPNILLALRRARELGLVATALTGGDGGQIVGLADPMIIVPSRTTARIQEMHITLGQLLCSALERALGLVP